MGKLFVPEQVDIEVRGEDVFTVGAIDLGGPSIVHWQASLLDITFGEAPVIGAAEELTSEEAQAFCDFDLQAFVASFTGGQESGGIDSTWLHDKPFPWYSEVISGGAESIYFWTPKSDLPQVRWEGIAVTPRYLYYKAHYCAASELTTWEGGELDGARAHVRFDLRFE